MADKTGSETMFEKVYFEAQEALDEILGPNEDDGYGQGLVGEIWLVARQRDAARRVVDSVTKWAAGDAPLDSLRGALELYKGEMAAIQDEIDA